MILQRTISTVGHHLQQELDGSGSSELGANAVSIAALRIYPKRGPRYAPGYNEEK